MIKYVIYDVQIRLSFLPHHLFNISHRHRNLSMAIYHKLFGVDWAAALERRDGVTLRLKGLAARRDSLVETTGPAGRRPAASHGNYMHTGLEEDARFTFRVNNLSLRKIRVSYFGDKG